MSSILVKQKREISSLKKSITQLQGKITEVARLSNFEQSQVESEISNWNNIVAELYYEIKKLLNEDQSADIREYLVRYCKSYNLINLMSDLDLVESEEDTEDAEEDLYQE
eukprot:NODE_120_length_18891_cov_0.302682.p11 type:complete len:110 gc:universal NODE_120_length_18891_cov_0.302682:6186-5857(-)